MWDELCDDLIVCHILSLMRPSDLLVIQKTSKRFRRLVRTNRGRLQRRKDFACKINLGRQTVWMRNAVENRYLVFDVQEAGEEQKEPLRVENLEEGREGLRRAIVVRSKLSVEETIETVWRLIMEQCSFSALAFGFYTESLLQVLLPFGGDAIHSHKNRVEQASFFNCTASSDLLRRWTRELKPRVLSIEMGASLDEDFFFEAAVQGVEKLEVDCPVNRRLNCDCTDVAFNLLQAMKILIVVHSISLTTDGIVVFLRKCYEEERKEKADETIVVKTNFKATAPDEEVWARVTGVLPLFEFNSRSTVTRNGRRMGLRLEYDAKAGKDGCKIYFIVIIMGPFEH